MIDRSLKFFIENYKINYALFIFLFIAGIYSYTQIPKEVEPNIEPNSISISGSYSGASVDILNKMAVTPLEDKLKNIVGITDIISTLQQGKFSILLELDKFEDKNTIKENVKEAIDAVYLDMPSDMDKPSTHTSGHSRSLMFISVLSTNLSREQILAQAQNLKEKLLKIKHIDEVLIYGDSEPYYEVILNEKKIEALGLEKQVILNALAELSHSFPIGKMEGEKQRFYIASSNARNSVDKLEKTLLKFQDQVVYLKDFAEIKKSYEKSSTLASMNGNSAITLSLSQSTNGDAIKISKEVQALLENTKIPEITYEIKMDNSIKVKGSLNVVFSNILFGILLIAMLTIILINFRMAFVIILGIPTAFVMGSIYFYFTGYSINVQSLIGVLLAIGIIVDDAIVIGENIQQYIERGHDPKEAAYLGTKEMIQPVFLASITTLFSFIPLLMISGRMGEIIALIPIAFSALIFASLIESFIFLPIHAVHILKKDSKPSSWEKAKNNYQKTLHLLLKKEKIFLAFFIICVPLLIFYAATNSKFHMFQNFDSSSINITVEGQNNLALEETYEIIKNIETEILKNKKEFFIDSIASTTGYRRTAGGPEMSSNVGNISIELQKRAPENFFEEYITPLLSLYPQNAGSRTISSEIMAKKIRAWIKKNNYKEKFNLVEIMVLERRMGASKSDIRIGIVTDDYQKGLNSIHLLEEKTRAIQGTKNIGNNIKFSMDEIQFTINDYGKSLGISEKYLGKYLGNIYLERDVTDIYESQKIYEMKVKSYYANDYDYFKNLPVILDNGSQVLLHEICELKTTRSLAKLIKDNGITTFYFFANVDNDIITSSEVLEQLTPTINALKKEGIRFLFKGEREQKEKLEVEMLLAIALSISLIFLSLLYLFNSIKETLLVISVIPFSMLGLYIGHFIMGQHLTMPSLIGAIGLAGVIVNDGIIMMTSLKKASNTQEFFKYATRRFRPIILTSLTTIIGLASLIFFATAEAASFQPIAITIGFGLLWGTILNLLYLPIMFHFLHKKRFRIG